MKFSEEKLFRLHKIVREVNKLDIGEFVLPERFGIFDKNGEPHAILIWNGQRYDLELVDENIESDHREEVEKTEEVKDK